MTLLEILVLAVVALLVYLIASHKISIASLSAKFQGVSDQLHQVHGAAIAAATVATPPAPVVTPIAGELVSATAPVPVTAEEIRAIVAAAIPAPAAVAAVAPAPIAPAAPAAVAPVAPAPAAPVLVNTTGPTMTQPRVGYPFDAGITRFPLPVALASGPYSVDAIPSPTEGGYGSGFVSVMRADGTHLCLSQQIVNGQASAFPLPLVIDETLTIVVECSRPGMVRFLIPTA